MTVFQEIGRKPRHVKIRAVEKTAIRGRNEPRGLPMWRDEAPDLRCAVLTIRAKLPPSWKQHLRQVFGLPYQRAQRLSGCLTLLRVPTVPIVAVLLAMRPAGTPPTSVHSAPRPAADRRSAARNLSPLRERSTSVATKFET